MSPVHTSRQLLVWSLPTAAILLGLLWYKRRRGSSKPSTTTQESTSIVSPGARKPESAPQSFTSPETRPSCSRSLTGLDASAPIDIKSSRSAPIHMSDTELDLEIERMRLAKAPQPPPSPVQRPLTPPVDRDSANHSPCGEAIAPPASPSLSSPSADHSDSDSGKGGSDVATPPPRPKQQSQPTATSPPAPVQEKPPQPPLVQPKQQKFQKQKQKLTKKQKRQQKFHPIETIDKLDEKLRLENGDVSLKKAVNSDVTEEKVNDQGECIIYEFVIPQSLVGRLIGKHGVFVHEIHEKTGASVLVKRHPLEGPHSKICALEGTKAAVDEALALIRTRFPLKRHPDLTLERITFAPVVPEYMYLRLIEGINNDTVVSCVETPVHLFVQQPTHPTYPSLTQLSAYMDETYANETNAPAVPWPATVSTICAAMDADKRWHRALVIESNDQTATVQLLDFGGFLVVEEGALRQIRADLVMVPFQATPCYLADIGPPGDDDTWPQEAYDVIFELTTSTIVYTQVIDYAEDGVPLVRMFVPVPGRRTTVLLNNELVDRGVAQRLVPIAT